MAVRRGVRGLVTLAVAAAAVPLSAGAAAPASNRPLNVVKRYLAALAAHNAHGVCATFSAQLRRFDVTWEGQGKTCTRSVAVSHFSSDGPGYNVRRIRIVRVTRIDSDRYGTVAVHLVLFWRFTCAGGVAVIPGCRPHFEDRRDVIYLRSERGRWLIVKPGEIYEDTSEAGAPWLNALWPPAVPASVDRQPTMGAPSEQCPSTGATASGGTADRTQRRAPWLRIERVHFTWLARRQLCISLTLGAPPRADSSYFVDLQQSQGGGTLVDGYGLYIDGTGTVLPQLRDRRDEYAPGKAACPTDAGLAGDRLTMVFSLGDRVFEWAKRINVQATTTSLQPGEPLLAHPLTAEDDVPGKGINLSPPRRGLPRCVRA
jgi:hypothetical protein